MGYLDTFKVEGKVALITGGSKGLGRSMALGLGEGGATVVVASRTKKLIEETAHDIIENGGNAIALPVDVKNKDDIDELINKITDLYGRVDIVINNAGIANMKLAKDITLEDWNDIIDTNLKSAFLISQSVSKIMARQKKGKIINVGSVLGMMATNMAMPYCVSKAGLAQMTRALALEWAHLGINVNCIAPGFIETEMTTHQQEDESILNFLQNKIPFRRLGKPDEIVGAALFLSSMASDYMTGAILVVDGGYTIW